MRPVLALSRSILLAAALAGCQPSTTRPVFAPVPEAATTEIRLSFVEATRRLAEELRADSIPITKVELRDGYLESPWFDSATGRPVHRRPLGLDRVRVRAWVDPSRPGFSRLTAETVYRPLADPALPDRELDRAVPRDHPVAVKIRATFEDMVKRYGGPPAVTPQPRAPAVPPAISAEEQGDQPPSGEEEDAGDESGAGERDSGNE